ncbi:hypothetical protein WICPIJ_005609 [Wickerhamomyces pijperi]|uniref:Peptidase S59 domain-containing protein n=1 Tax=Wickerhamomyces pijperi TaxID=599730 RepID=A0A9P8TLS6_WICPI|nr:hypothetical protein WICPIJ_005609 [Wickerhamomyces pijperi]
MFGNSFGQSNTNTAAGTGGGLFGSTNPPASNGFSFGNNNNTNTTAPTSGLFGNSASSTGTSGGLFGNKPAAPATGGLFGNNNTNASTTTASTGGLFGASAPSSTGGMFGNTTNTPATTTGGLFGNSSAAPAAPATSTGGLFGSKPAAPTGGLFGNTSTTPAQSTGGGLFGNSSTGASTTGGLFGSKPAAPATSGLFGSSSTPAASGGLFGSKPAAATPATGGMFGNSTNPAPTSGLFGNSTQQKTGGLFGNNTTNNSFGVGVASAPAAPAAAAPAVQQFNVKDLPKSITESTKASASSSSSSFSSSLKHSRKRSLSSSGVAVNNELLKSSIINKLSTTFISGVSKVNYNAEGLFSPRNNELITSSQSPSSESFTIQKKTPSSHTATILKSSHTFRSKNTTASDYLKLKVDPSRSEAMKLKLFGESGNAQKVRILGREEPEAVPTDNQSQNVQESTSKNQPPSDRDSTPVSTSATTKNSAESSSKPLQVQSEFTVVETTKDEYWCSPSISELSKYQLGQLTNVSNFAIGRKGYGTIWFQDPVDLSSFCGDLQTTLFGKIVRFKNKTVEVYPDGSVPFGSGLNVPAVITIEKLFPVIKTSSKAKPVDSTAPGLDKDYQLRLFVKKLKDQREMEFITYDPINGNWTFKVKHFSIWGIVDEDTVVIDLDEVREEEEKETQANKVKEQAATSTRVEVEDEEEEPMGVIRSQQPAPTFEETLLLKRQRIQSISEAIPGAFVLEKSFLEVTPPTSANIFPTESSQHSEDEDVIEGDEHAMVIASAPEEEEPLEEVDEKDYEPLDVSEDDFANLNAEPQLETSDDWDTQLEIAGKYNSAFGNSKLFQTLNGGVGGVKTLSALNRILYERELKEAEDKMDEDSEEEKPLDSQSQSTVVPLVNKEIVQDVYQAHRSQVSVSTGQGFPQIELNSEFQFKSLLASLKTYNTNTNEFHIWQLASILFDDHVTGTSDISNPTVAAKLLDTKRREGVISWLKGQVETELNIRFDSQNDSFEKIYTLIVQQKIPEACKLAYKTKNSHLAVLISLLGSNDPQVKESARAQLNDWKRNSVLQTIPRGIQSIYQLLAGGDSVLKPAAVTVDEPLSWRSKLLLVLSNGDLNQTLDVLFVKFIKSEHGVVKKDDLIYFELLKLYTFQHNSSCVASSILEFSKTEDVRVKWYVFNFLTHGPSKIPLPSALQLGDKLTVQLATQFESQGLLEQSLFTLLHHSNQITAKDLVTDFLNRNINKLTDSEIETALDSFHIPSTIIHTAKAKYFHSLSDFWSEATSLLNAGSIELAHDLIIKECAPDAVIDNSDKLLTLDLLIDRFPEDLPVKGWDTGLGVYKSYIRFHYDSNDKTALIHLLDHLATVQTSNFNINIATQIMSKRVAKEVLSLSGSADSLELDVEKIWNLPLSKSDLGFFKTLVRGREMGIVNTRMI